MWFFRSPEIVYGEDSLSYLASLDMKRVAIVTDRFLKSSRVIDRVLAAIPKEVSSIVVADINPEPTFEEMTLSLPQVRDFSPDWFLAVGGGSSIDTAKLLFALYERPDISFYDITPLVKLNLRRKSRLAALPTTSGTGSECSWAAVVTEEADETGSRKARKVELASKEIMPDIAILDPILVSELPAEQTRNTATDAIVHAVEAYVSSWRNPYSDALAEKALELITPNLPKVLAEPDDIAARNDIHIGASMAGLSFSNSQIGLAHAMGHALGSLFRIPHGLCVGLFLPYVVEFNQSEVGERYSLLNRKFPEKYRKSELSLTLKSYLAEVGMPLTAREAGISRERYKEMLEELVDLASESTGVTTNARDASRDDIRRIFILAGG
ncbi:MAG: iron-containing alcohol dehydrogenase [Conexivisphaerales archaeon]